MLAGRTATTVVPHYVSIRTPRSEHGGHNALCLPLMVGRSTRDMRSACPSIVRVRFPRVLCGCPPQ